MQPIWKVCLAGFGLPTLVAAGQVYGSVSTAGKAVPRAGIAVRCGAVATPGTTADDGSYRINVGPQGKCILELPSFPGRPSADVFSYPNPTRYDFDLVRLGNGTFVLRRR